MRIREWRWATAILGLVMIAGGWGDRRDGLVIGGGILVASVVIAAALSREDPSE